MKPASTADQIAPLREFVMATTEVVVQAMDESARIAAIKPLLARLISSDGWLCEDAAKPHPEHYCQYLLHCDPLERFSVVSFVWGPGQRTPIHNHTVWGLIGMLRGAETGQHYRRESDGRLVPSGEPCRLERGDVELVSPTTGDIHQVANAHADRTSISVHVYGANIGAVARHVFDAAGGQAKSFVSGYSSSAVPNLWDRSETVRRNITGAAA
ncbi:MAG: cysteine dioxygenase [Pseudomonadota bacterium]